MAPDWIEESLALALDSLINVETPPLLAACLQGAIFPGGARVRPTLLVAVAEACGHDRRPAVGAAAAALELLHCASLVQDDLNCFDAADTRRNVPALHRRFGPGLALLATDALIVGSFEVLAGADPKDLRLGIDMVKCLARHTGARGGITAGQAWEAESSIDVATYHAAKTGALFVAAVELGALCSGANPADWSETGKRIGAAYQVADDLIDVLGSDTACGKPIGVDASLGRPNIVHDLGIDAATQRFHDLIEGVLDGLPRCAHPSWLRECIQEQTRRVLPTGVGRSAA